MIPLTVVKVAARLMIDLDGTDWGHTRSGRILPICYCVEKILRHFSSIMVD